MYAGNYMTCPPQIGPRCGTAFKTNSKMGSLAPSSFQSSENIQLIATYDGIQNWEHLNLIIPAYFDLMRQFPSVILENARDIHLH